MFNLFCKILFLFGLSFQHIVLTHGSELTDKESDRFDSDNSTTTCDGYKECAGDSINKDYAYCGGYYGCYEADIRVNKIAYLDGLRGAQESDISSDGDVFCGGYLGCFMADIYAENDTICDGVSSCWHGQIEAEDNIYLLGYRSGGAAEINGQSDDTALYAYGSYATIYSVISGVSTIYNYGFTGLYYADIDSKKVDELNIYSLGRFSGLYAQIYCRSGSTCNIFCRDYGCYGMEIRCYKGAKCKYTLWNPSCASSPTLLYSKDDDDDAAFDQLLETRKKAKSIAKQELQLYAKEHDYTVDQLQDTYEELIKNSFEALNLVDGKLIENEIQHTTINREFVDVSNIQNNKDLIYASEYSDFVATHKHGQNKSFDIDTLCTVSGVIVAILLLFGAHKYNNKMKMQQNMEHDRYQYQSI